MLHTTWKGGGEENWRLGGCGGNILDAARVCARASFDFIVWAFVVAVVIVD